MRTLADRLRSCRDDLGLSQTELAKRAGVSQSTVANIEGGRNQGSKHLIDIAEALNVRVEWLNSGKGAKDPTTPHHINQHERYRIPENKGNVSVWVSEEDLEKEGRVWIDRFDYHFSAGDGLIQWEVREKKALPFNESFFKAIRTRPKDCKLVCVRGDSMEPFLFDHDVFMIDTTKTALRDGKIYAVYFEDEPLVKQIFKNPGGRIVLHSFNPAYPDILVEPRDMGSIHIVGECVYRSGSGFTSH